jgi:hypothetical protein
MFPANYETLKLVQQGEAALDFPALAEVHNPSILLF